MLKLAQAPGNTLVEAQTQCLIKADEIDWTLCINAPDSFCRPAAPDGLECDRNGETSIATDLSYTQCMDMAAAITTPVPAPNTTAAPIATTPGP